MCKGSSTTTQQTTIPPEIMANYKAVYSRAEDAAKQPFQKYSTDPNAFVAPLNATQILGIQQAGGFAQAAQPAFAGAQQLSGTAYNDAMTRSAQSISPMELGMAQSQNQFGQATGLLNNAYTQGQVYGRQAYQPIAGALSSAQPYMQQATGLTSGGLGAAAPMMGAAEGYLGGGTQAVNAQDFGQAQINKYMSPYMKNVVEAQQALQQQEAAAQRSALNSQAIGAGAFGGDRAGIAQANLARQQSLANQANLSNLLQQGYGQAQNMFQQQQGVNLAAQQANRAAQQFGSQQAANLGQQRYAQQMGVGQQLAALGQQQFAQNIGAGQALSALGNQMYQQGLGAAQTAQNFGTQQFQTGLSAAQQQAGLAQQMYNMGSNTAQLQANLGAGAQSAALQGAQAALQAGTLEQQTEQAGKTALYNQFQQERGYPFQLAQFLGNIAMGTGSLSGSTTTTTQPNSWFSDRRLKKDIKEIGETHDGLPIYSFKYKGGDDQPRIGVMADEAREKHPDAVHRVGGIDAVDYEKIANRASEGGGVMPHRAGEGFAEGGHVSPEDLSAILAMQKQFLGPHGQAGLYGQSSQNLPGSAGVVPQMQLAVARPPRHAAPPQQQYGARQAMSDLGQANQLGETILGDKGLVAKGKQAYKYFTDPKKPQETNSTANRGQTSAKVPQPISSSPPKPAPEAQPSQAQGLGQGSVVGATKDDILPEFYTDSLPAARGGVVPHKAKGGKLQEKVLPYQSDDPYGVEAVNESESGENYDLLGEDSGKKSGSGGGGKSGSPALKLGLKAASMGANFIPGVGPFISAGLNAASSMFNEGGVVPRQGFQEGGGAKEYGLDDYLNSLATIESGHRYEAQGPVTKRGDRAYGKYQVMGANIPSWTEEHYGQRLTPQQFLENKEAQETVARGQFGKYLNQYGTPEDAASAWFSGRPMSRAGNSADILGTTVPAYINKFRANLGLDPLGGGVPNDGQRRSVAGAETVVGEDGQRREYVNGQPVSKGIGAPMEYRTGKPFESIGDFLTSRQFIVPLLSGVGAMASSPSRYFGGALLQGIGAAANTYAGMEKPITEGEERRGLASTAAETAKKIAAETKVVEAGLYEKKWIPGVGWWVYDRTKPYEIGKQLTDTNMQPVGGASVDLEKIPTAKDSPKPPTSVGAPTTAPTGGTTQPPKTTEKPTTAPAYEWKPTVNVPDNFTPKEHFNIVNSPEIMSREATIAAGQLREQRSKAEGAYNQLYRLDEMQHSFDQLPKTGFLEPGSYGTERADFAKKINTAAAVLGGKPIFNPSDIAAAETLGKDTFRLGQEAARSSGSREAQAIVQASVGATPGIDNTPMAYKRIASGMRQAAQYELDRTAFLDSYNAKFGHINGADELFRKLNPASEYARQAVVSTIDPTDLKDVQDFIARNKGRPMDQLLAKIAPKLDAEYGKGTAAIILGVH